MTKTDQSVRRKWQPLRWFATGADISPSENRQQLDREYRRSRISILLSVALGYGFLYTCRLPLSVIKQPLIDAGIFDAATLGRIGSAFALGYAFGKLAGGVLADHANVRKLFSLCVLLSAVTNLLMLGSHSAWAWSRALVSQRLVPGFRRTELRSLNFELVQHQGTRTPPS